MNQFSVVEQVGCWPAGSLLFREGEASAGIYVIHSGTVDLVFSAPNGIAKPLRKLHTGDVAGLSDAVSNALHDCTATTRTAARIGFVPITELRHLLDQQPAIWFAIAKFISADVNACWGSMRRLAAGR